MKNLKTFAAVIALPFLVACGGSSSPTSSGPVYPQVAGNYAGTTTVTFPELGQQVTCPTTTSVAGSGPNISIAPLVLGGPCGNMSFPFGAVTIDTNGQFPDEVGTFNEPTCGVYQYTGSGGFFGQEARFSINATSSTCWNMNMTILLSR